MSTVIQEQDTVRKGHKNDVNGPLKDITNSISSLIKLSKNEIQQPKNYMRLMSVFENNPKIINNFIKTSMGREEEGGGGGS